MQIALFYFSGTGNTKFICDKFKVLMESRNNNVTLYDIEAVIKETRGSIFPAVLNSDIIGLAYPVYGANLPRIVNNFIEYLKNGNNKKIFIISTVSVINAYGPFIIRNKLRKHGYLLKWHYVYYTVNNTKTRSVNREILEQKHSKNSRRFSQFCDSIIADRIFYHGIGPWIIGGYAVRILLKKPIAEFYRSLWVDDSICTKCNVCITRCPTEAIKLSHNKFVFQKECTTCFRCINNCHVNAIKIRKHHKYPGPLE
ncbi:MAG: EFR1 family ferrodoxin [Spirochaetales bacterium]|nr:EFR1 family ferrodoxin [Spirochaetales bacterium]